MGSGWRFSGEVARLTAQARHAGPGRWCAQADRLAVLTKNQPLAIATTQGWVLSAWPFPQGRTPASVEFINKASMCALSLCSEFAWRDDSDGLVDHPSLPETRGWPAGSWESAAPSESGAGLPLGPSPEPTRAGPPGSRIVMTGPVTEPTRARAVRLGDGGRVRAVRKRWNHEA